MTFDEEKEGKIGLKIWMEKAEREICEKAATLAGLDLWEWAKREMLSAALRTFKQPVLFPGCEPDKNAAAIGSVGGKRRAEKLTAEQRSEIARLGGKARAAKNAQANGNFPQ